MLPKKPFQPFFSAPSNSKKFQDIVLSKGKDIFLASTLMMAATSPPHHRHRLQAQAMLDTWRPFLFFLKVILSTSPPVRNHFQRNSSGSGPWLGFPLAWLGLWMLLQITLIFFILHALHYYSWFSLGRNETKMKPQGLKAHTFLRWVV